MPVWPPSRGTAMVLQSPSRRGAQAPFPSTHCSRTRAIRRQVAGTGQGLWRGSTESKRRGAQSPKEEQTEDAELPKARPRPGGPMCSGNLYPCARKQRLSPWSRQGRRGSRCYSAPVGRATLQAPPSLQQGQLHSVEQLLTEGPDPGGGASPMSWYFSSRSSWGHSLGVVKRCPTQGV